MADLEAKGSVYCTLCNGHPLACLVSGSLLTEQMMRTALGPEYLRRLPRSRYRNSRYYAFPARKEGAPPGLSAFARIHKPMYEFKTSGPCNNSFDAKMEASSIL